MSRFDQAVGLARSLAIYHLIPRRQRALRTLYGRLTGPGDLVFDVGAHVGTRTRALAALGCHVVAVEPQPAMAAALRAAGLAGLVVLAPEPVDAPLIGTATGGDFARRVKQAIDPGNRFGPWGHADR